MIDPQAARMVTIPAWVDEGGVLRFFYGGPLPALAPGAIIDLVMAETSLQNLFMLRLLTESRTCTLLPAGETLVAEMRFPDKQRRKSYANHVGITDVLSGDPCVLGVLLTLEDDLCMEMSLGKPATLLDCRCAIPALGSVKARSVNHAYTLISQHYEQHRRSHTGNVFAKVYAWRAHPPTFSPLEQLRISELQQIEQAVIAACDPWWYCGKRGAMPDTWAILDAPGDEQATVSILEQLPEYSGAPRSEWRARIVGTQALNSRVNALGWLQSRGFEHLPEIDYPALTAPQPPYYTAGGEPDTTLNWADRSAYLQRAQSYFEARRRGSRPAALFAALPG